GRPQMSCSIFGVRERMRVPWPAARITTVVAVTGGRLEGRRGQGSIRGGRSGFALVRTAPLADRVVADAVSTPDGRVSQRVDLGEQSGVRRAHDAPPRGLGAAVALPAPGTRRRAVALAAAHRPEHLGAHGARAIVVLARLVPAAVRVEGGVAVRTHDPQVLEAMVVVRAVDVVEHERHATPAPHLSLAAALAA